MALCVHNYSARGYFDKLFEDVEVRELSSHSEPERGFGRVSDVVFAEGISEKSFRTGFFTSRIIDLGLNTYLNSILNGINASIWDWCDVPVGMGRDGQRLFRAESDHILRYGIDYIDRWIMYNKLFGSISAVSV